MAGEAADRHRLEHTQSPGLTTVHADGSMLSRTSGETGKIQLTFFCDTVLIHNEKMVPIEGSENTFRLEMDESSTTPVREHVSRVAMTPEVAKALANMILKNLEGSE